MVGFDAGCKQRIVCLDVGTDNRSGDISQLFRRDCSVIFSGERNGGNAHMQLVDHRLHRIHATEEALRSSQRQSC